MSEYVCTNGSCNNHSTPFATPKVFNGKTSCPSCGSAAATLNLAGLANIGVGKFYGVLAATKYQGDEYGEHIGRQEQHEDNPHDEGRHRGDNNGKGRNDDSGDSDSNDDGDADDNRGDDDSSDSKSKSKSEVGGGPIIPNLRHPPELLNDRTRDKILSDRDKVIDSLMADVPLDVTTIKTVTEDDMCDSCGRCDCDHRVKLVSPDSNKIRVREEGNDIIIEFAGQSKSILKCDANIALRAMSMASDIKNTNPALYNALARHYVDNIKVLGHIGGSAYSIKYDGHPHVVFGSVLSALGIKIG